MEYSMTVSAQPTHLAEANTVRAERSQVHFLDNLNYLLDWPLSADDIAAKLGCKDAAAVEKRLERLGITETPLAEEFRKHKPEYCSECRLTHGRHRQHCREFIPSRGADERNRRKAEREALAVSA